LLAGRPSRLRFAVTHALTSAALGGVSWAAISVIDALGAGGHWPLGFTPKAAAAFVYISALAWAASVPFSRYSAGVAWLIVAIGLAGSGRLIALRNDYVAASDTWTGMWQALGPVLLFPPVMVGEPSTPSVGLIALVITAAAAALLTGVFFVAHYDLALEDVE
jgi:hypothetical protein